MSEALIETVTGFETQDLVVLGVVSDTHVPDRADRLHSDLLEKLKSNHVDIILHAGDICVPTVLEQLETVAPVFAVRGNRDFYFLNLLPMSRTMTLAGHRLALTHGHGGLQPYLTNKIKMLLTGYNLGIFLPTILESVPDAEVYVFGHTHFALNVWYNEDRLLFNPGSCSSVFKPRIPSFGILRLEKDKKAVGEIIELKGERIKNRRWVKEKSIS
jgi:putative phosphoesterase